MRILITNDDGINAIGLSVLELIARTFTDDVWIVAPQSDQSGCSHALTFSDPLRVTRYDRRRFAVSGTPADCVIMAIHEIMDVRPDIVLSGVNHGRNVATDVTYSGTIGAAMEGTLLGVQSFALSQACDFYSGDPVHWKTSETHAPLIIKKLLAHNVCKTTFFNINFPHCRADETTGISLTHHAGMIEDSTFIDRRIDGRGDPYFWLSYKQAIKNKDVGSDIHALAQNKISVTPLVLDLTNSSVIDALKDLEE